MARVLVADDSPFMRRVLKEILHEGGYIVAAECQNGLEAFEQYKEVHPDLVLMDYNMPKMNGIDAARAILKHDPKAVLIMVTAVGGKKRIIEALRLGAKNYITKPFEDEMFLATVDKVMGSGAPQKRRAKASEEEDFQVISSFFGQYLLQKGVITKEQLLKVLEIQQDVNRKIGQIAVDEGLMLPQKVDTIIKVQKRINKYFGQLAVQMGFLNQEQVSHLLKQQKERYIEVEEILEREKILASERLQQELELFKRMDEEDHGVFNMRWVSQHIQGGHVYEILVEQTLKLVMRLAGIFIMEGESSFERKEFTAHGMLIKIQISGDAHCSYFLNLSENLAELIADGMLEEEETPESGDVHMEAANEFANIACGNAVGKLDGKGIKLEISPPSTSRLTPGTSLQFAENEQILYVPVMVPEGNMELLIVGVDIFRTIGAE